MINPVRIALASAALLVLAGPSFAAVESHRGPVEAAVPEIAAPTPGSDVLAFTQRSIPVGPRSLFGQEWRCSIRKNGATYFSTAFTESQARATLATRVAGRASCFRERRFLFFGVD